MFSRFSKLASLTNFCAIALSLATPSAFAGTRDTGGGTGIVVGKRLVVLDLVEADLQNSATIPAIEADPSIRAALVKNLKLPEPMKSQVLEPLAKKLTDIELGGGKSTGMLMATAFGFYTFHATDLKLTAIDDVDSAIGESRIQLAVRKGPAIYVSTPNWERLDTVNRVALLMHEIIYAFQPLPTGCQEVTATIPIYSSHEDCSSSAIDSVLATSAKARFMNAYFFRADWRRTWLKELTPEMSVSDQRAIYSSLFDSMYEEAQASYGFRGHIARMEIPADADNRFGSENELYPVYSSISVNGKGGIKLLTRATSVAAIESICASDELADPAPEHRFFGLGAGSAKAEDFSQYAARSLQQNGHPVLRESNTALKFEMDVVSVDGETNGLSLQSLPEFRAECVQRLRAYQKKLQ